MLSNWIIIVCHKKLLFGRAMSGKYPASPFSLLPTTYCGKPGIQTTEGHHNNPLSLGTCTNVNFSNGFSRLERSYLYILLCVEG